MIEEKIHGHHLSIYSQLAIVSLHINWHIYLEELASRVAARQQQSRG